MTGARLNVDAPTADLYRIVFPDGTYYTDRNDLIDMWPLHIASAIGRNVAMKNKCTVSIKKVNHDEELITAKPESNYYLLLTYDETLLLVNDLRGVRLRNALKFHSLAYGSDSAYSKRERLFAHLANCNHHADRMIHVYH